MKEDEEDIIRKRKAKFKGYLLLFIGLACFSFFLPWLFTREAWFDNIIFDGTTGPLGDTIGGTMGPFVGLIAALLTFFAFWEQYKANEQQRLEIARQKKQVDIDAFENTFFEMIHLHRENVSELKYVKSNGKELIVSENRKVFHIIFQEFTECYREVTKFYRFTNDYLKPEYEAELKQMVSRINPAIDLKEMCMIDIAYSIVFHGINEEGENVLRFRFKPKYNNAHIFQLLEFIRLKPKMDEEIRFSNWEYIRGLEVQRLRAHIHEIYEHKRGRRNNVVFTLQEIESLIENTYFKYYGGHQHRLGHYFRHLFQSYKYLHYHQELTTTQKYFYAKTLRAQLSTYEQALLFINSISTLGMKWEFKPEFHNENNLIGDALNKELEKSHLITHYHLIKNLPGEQILDLKYKSYYPNVKYESVE